MDLERYRIIVFALLIVAGSTWACGDDYSAIGEEEVARQIDLDTSFGPTFPPRLVKSFERDSGGQVFLNPTRQILDYRLPDQQPLVLDPGKSYNWLIDAGGRLIVAEQFQVDGGRLGHPTLNGGAPARIAGDLYFDGQGWVINQRSLRYSINREGRGVTELNNVQRLFERFGQTVTVHDITSID